MLIREAHKMFDVYLDKVASDSYPEILPSEKDIFINNATEILVKTRYGKNNIYKAGFEENQKRTDELNVLVKTGFPKLTKVDYESNTYKADISDIYVDSNYKTKLEEVYWFFLKASCSLTTNCGTKYIQCKLIQQDDLTKVLNDPFNKPNKNKVIIYFEEGGIYIVIPDNSEINNFKLTFLKQPRKVSVNILDSTGRSDVTFELPESLHVDIVKLAVNEALDIIESPRKQQFVNNLNNLE